MIEIEIPGRAKIHCKKFSNLMDVLIKSGLPVARACDREGICGKCGVHVLKGVENLPAITALEEKSLNKENLAEDVRLTCLVSVLGPVSVKADYW